MQRQEKKGMGWGQLCQFSGITRRSRAYSSYHMDCSFLLQLPWRGSEYAAGASADFGDN